MSKFKVTFTLKQHTPIIHFQSNQNGATLRASELKPKFDRFLKKYAFGGNVPNEYKIAEDKDALNYKIFILKMSNSTQFFTYKTFKSKKDKNDPNIKVGSYFGDNKAISTKNGIKVEIVSFNTELIKIIEKYFIDFILITNFGTRQNKGFGSFSAIEVDNNPISIDINQVLLKYYHYVYIKNSTEPLKSIQQDYQRLKSGTNKPQYNKSLLFEYMCKDNIKWEKRMIKEYMQRDFSNIFQDLKYEKQPIKCQNENQNFNYKYIRGLLGITEQIEFLKSNARNFKDKIKISIKSTNKNIERFKSPITFKVIDNNIYVLATSDIPIKGELFEFKIKGENKILNEAIEIPKEFDIYRFLNFALPRLKYQILKA